METNQEKLNERLQLLIDKIENKKIDIQHQLDLLFNPNTYIDLKEEQDGDERNV